MNYLEQITKIYKEAKSMNRVSAMQHRHKILQLCEEAIASDGYWIVTVHYDPGTPRTYQVVGATTGLQAEEAALRDIGYNPGVPLRSQVANGKPDPSGYPVLRYRPLTNSEREAIRYND